MEVPAPKFGHFENVRVVGQSGPFAAFRGEQGMVVWMDSYAVRNRKGPAEWMYVVELPKRSCWKTFFESALQSERTFSPDSAHLGERPEISFDVVLEDDNDWAEGSYRLPGEFWKVAIFQKDDVAEIRWDPTNWERPTIWEKTASGLVIRLPRAMKVDRDALLRAMSLVTGYSDWVKVDGPDSMSLR